MTDALETDDMAEALADLADSPDVTAVADEIGAQDAPQGTPQGGPQARPQGAPQVMPPDPREDRLDEGAASAMGRGASRAYERATGEPLDDDSASVLSEWIKSGLDLSRRYGLGPWPRFGILTAVAALILAPAVLELGKTMKGAR